MKKLIPACFIAAALALPAIGYAADSPKTIVKDTVITAKVKSRMAADRETGAMHIDVETDNKGVVTLTGKAKTRAEADKAVAIARATSGVFSVEDNIRVTNER